MCPPDEHAAAPPPAAVAACPAIFPQSFFAPRPVDGAAIYRSDPAAQKLVDFFRAKGLAALKAEDERAQWYDDWLTYQARHKLYAGLLTPRDLSAHGGSLNLLRLTRFIEIFGYCSPAHGYSLQVTFLGFFAILMGTNAALKRETAAALENGGLCAFGISEKAHGSDLLGNGFTLRQSGPDRFIANGSKYYIGNANVAALITVLARREDQGGQRRTNRAPVALFALRPGAAEGFTKLRKIPTLGVRSAFVGAFDVREQEVPASDLIAEGRHAWDAIFGTVALGRFFLGFGQIGICERAWEEAIDHLQKRILYGRPAIEMPHLRTALAEAYMRLTAMKLYAYRALDYVQCATADDRRYLLFTAVQKARVSTEGVRVMALLSECIGARGFEAETYFEMALRDAQLIPGLEGSAHINMAQAGQFILAYFGNFDSAARVPPTHFFGQVQAEENAYLMQVTTRGSNTIRFRHYLEAYRPQRTIPSVRQLVRQAIALRLFLRRARRSTRENPETALALGGCLTMIAYAQLIAENAALLGVAEPLISAIFQLLVRDLSNAALTLATLPSLDDAERERIGRMVITPPPRGAEWDVVARQMCGMAR